MKKIINEFGWIGALLIISAYALISFNVITSTSITYQLLNFFGALGLILSSYSKKDMQPVMVNLFWASIALLSIIKGLL